ncbi:uncharacterized protein LOC122555098 [Chiloscyllium plagiosum]|uniref:uncharacterized protein LOC122555098 n=1 Tax=Chiloscyllium plagiosum TaxID=36176 RepID=UPI001CB81A0D|nr:uncharacterized protein LOC122555098 [Chiloscyllium plagiosum]
MGFIHRATALLALNMNGLLTVLACLDESSRNATLGESILLNPNYTDCEMCSVEWTFSSHSENRRISSYVKSKGPTSETIFRTFEHKVNIEDDGFFLRLLSIQLNDTGKYTRTFTASNGIESCVSVIINVYAESEVKTLEVNQSNAEVHSSRIITHISASIVGSIFGGIILVLIIWIVIKLIRRRVASENKSSLSIQMSSYPIYGNWKIPTYA